jgi:hypothetical protein
LIPLIGVYGAALAMLLGNLVELYWVNRHATREYDMGLQWKKVNILFLVCAVCVVTGMLMPVGELIWFIMRVGLFVGMAILVYYMPFWHVEDRILMKATYSNVTGRLINR